MDNHDENDINNQNNNLILMNNIMTTITANMTQHVNSIGSNPTNDQLVEMMPVILKQHLMSEQYNGFNDAEASQTISNFQDMFEPLAMVTLNIRNALVNVSDTSENIINENIDNTLELINNHVANNENYDIQNAQNYLGTVRMVLIEACRQIINRNQINFNDSIYLPD